MTKRDAGFTLIESLVATSVFVLVISALYQGLSTGWRGLKKAKAEDVAIAVATAELASIGVETPLVTSTQSGVTRDGISWQSDLRPYVRPGRASNTPEPYQGYWVSVTVRWHEGRFTSEQSMQFTTLKFKKAL